MKTILITGGSGLVGRKLSAFLIEKGYQVLWLSRQRDVKADIPIYRWNFQQKEIDRQSIEKADVIIHLAGENLAEGSWTKSKKQRIVESRVKTAEFLLEITESVHKKPEVFISASAIGYYGMGAEEKIFSEDDDSSEDDFLSFTCQKWESAAFEFKKKLNIRTVVLRTGFVMAKNSKAFKKMTLPVRFGLGATLGTGRQYFSWIHIDDLCRIYLKSIEDIEMQGVFNAVAPEFTTNSNFMKTLSKMMKRPFFMPKIPSFLIRLMLGEAAGMVLGGSRISVKKIQNAGFPFQFGTLEKALRNVLEK
jgi:uncharacterized protein (TIGR01777 family)